MLVVGATGARRPVVEESIQRAPDRALVDPDKARHCEKLTSSSVMSRDRHVVGCRCWDTDGISSPSAQIRQDRGTGVDYGGGNVLIAFGAQLQRIALMTSTESPTNGGIQPGHRGP